MKKANCEKEFNESDFICPFKNMTCIKEKCTHFKSDFGKHIRWNEIKIYDQAVCCAGGEFIYLWESCFTIKPSYKDIPLKIRYKIYKEMGHNHINSILLADMHREKIEYDFEEIFKMIKNGTFDPMIVPLK
jgi:hypothetical protein